VLKLATDVQESGEQQLFQAATWACLPPTVYVAHTGLCALLQGHNIQFCCFESLYMMRLRGLQWFYSQVGHGNRCSVNSPSGA
jgi:hypothetical protein